MRDKAGRFGVNAVTLLAALILVLILVMGGFSLSASQGGIEGAEPSEPTGAYAVTINESTVVVRNVDGDPAV